MIFDDVKFLCINKCKRLHNYLSAAYLLDSFAYHHCIFSIEGAKWTIDQIHALEAREQFAREKFRFLFLKLSRQPFLYVDVNCHDGWHLHTPHQLFSNHSFAVINGGSSKSSSTQRLSGVALHFDMWICPSSCQKSENETRRLQRKILPMKINFARGESSLSVAFDWYAVTNQTLIVALRIFEAHHSFLPSV